jgi:hypothetical protein
VWKNQARAGKDAFFLVESDTIVVEQNKYARKIVSLLLPEEEAQVVHELNGLLSY